MNDTTKLDAMPAEVATALLLSGQSMENRFRKVCKTARERVCEPVSRSTALNISAPATPLQKFERKLRKANAKQLTTWLRRATRRGNRLQDLLFEAQDKYLEARFAEVADQERLIQALEQQIAQIDILGQAMKNELDNRSTRGKVSRI